MRFLLVADRLDKDLTPAGRRRLYDAIRQLSSDAHRVGLGEIVLDLGSVDADLETRLQRLEALREWVDLDAKRGEPLIKGTRVPLYMVAALARGQTIAEIVEDFTSLIRSSDLGGTARFSAAQWSLPRFGADRDLKKLLSAVAGTNDV